MKVIKALILLIILALIAAPYGISYWAEGEYNRMITQLNALYKDDVRIVGTFSKGYLQSTATTEVTHLGIDKKLKLVHTINQGPIILDFKGWLNPSSYIPKAYGLAAVSTVIVGDVNDEIAHIYNQKPAYSINTMINFNGAGETSVKNFPLSTNVANGRVDWQGFDLTINNSLHFIEIQGKLIMPSFTYSETVADQSGEKSVNVKNIRLDFTKNTQTFNDSLNLTIEQISATDEEAAIISLNQVSLTGTDQFAGDMLTMDTKFNFSKLIVMQDEYGPLTSSFKLKNINYKILKELNNADNAMQMAVPGVPQNAAQPAEVDPTAKILAFLANRPTADFTMNLNTTKGDVDVNAHLEVGDKSITALDPALIMATINSEVKMKISTTIVYALLSRYAEQQIQEQESMFFMTNKDPNAKNPYSLNAEKLQSTVESWVNNILNELRTRKLIVEENDSISTDIVLNAMVYTVNGTERSQDDWQALQPLLIVTFPETPTPSTTVTVTPPDAAGNSSIEITTTPTTAPPAPATDMNSTTAVPPATTMPATMPAQVAPTSTTTTTTTTTMPTTVAPEPATTMPATDQTAPQGGIFSTQPQ